MVSHIGIFMGHQVHDARLCPQVRHNSAKKKKKTRAPNSYEWDTCERNGQIFLLFPAVAIFHVLAEVMGSDSEHEWIGRGLQ